nr:MAG TPA: putative peptidoglycan binding domain protein [Caudoviricetes sp.]
MAKASEIMKLAKSYVGTKESPAYSNNVIFNTHYYGHEVSGGNYAWCVVFVWDIFRMAGASNLFCDGKKTAWVDTVRDWAKSKGLVVSKDQGRHGDLALFDWNHNGSGDHIGFIDAKNADGSYETCEGNTSVDNNSNGGEVQIRTRYPSEIMMIIRPQYEAEEISPTPTPTKEATVKMELRMLKRGMSGNDVRAAMLLMKDKGYYPYAIPATDKLFGPKMEAGVRKMQAEHNLGVDGVIGHNSWTFLLK